MDYVRGKRECNMQNVRDQHGEARSDDAQIAVALPKRPISAWIQIPNSFKILLLQSRRGVESRGLGKGPTVGVRRWERQSPLVKHVLDHRSSRALLIGRHDLRNSNGLTCWASGTIRSTASKPQKDLTWGLISCPRILRIQRPAAAQWIGLRLMSASIAEKGQADDLASFT